MAKKYTSSEREAVRGLIRRLFERSGERSWAAFARRAGVSELSLNSWKSGREMPGAVNLLKLLAAVDVLGPAYELPGEPGAQTPLLERLEALARRLDAVARRLEAGLGGRTGARARPR